MSKMWMMLKPYDVDSAVHKLRDWKCIHIVEIPNLNYAPTPEKYSGTMFMAQLGDKWTTATYERDGSLNLWDDQLPASDAQEAAILYFSRIWSQRISHAVDAVMKAKDVLISIPTLVEKALENETDMPA